MIQFQPGTKQSRPFLRLLLALALLLSIAGLSLIAFLQSDWLTQHLRRAVINGVQDATGARVTIPGFRWDWRALTVEMQGFTMRGFEPVAGPPLLTAPLVRVRLRIRSLLNQQIEVSSLLVTRPQFNLIVGPDGTTNIPGPKHPLTPRQIIENLLAFQLPFVEAKEGLAQINDQRLPFNFTANHISVLIQYRRANHRYYLSADSPALRLGGSKDNYFDGSLQAKGELWRNHFSLVASHFHSRASDLRVAGTLDDFDVPVVDCNFSSSFATTETLRDFGFKGLTGGVIQLDGIGHHDSKTPFFVDAQLKTDHLSASLPGLQLQDVRFNSRLVADNSGLQFSDLTLSTTQGQFAGQGTLIGYRDLQVSGKLSRVDLQTTASSLLHKSLPWSATVGGPLQLKALVRPSLSNLIVSGALTLEPQSKGIPLSGDVQFAYNQREQALALQDSHLRLPNTRISLNTEPGKAISFTLDTTNLGDLKPGLFLIGEHFQNLPFLTPGGSAHVKGTAHLPGTGTSDPGLIVDAAIDVFHAQYEGTIVDRLRSTFTASPSQLHLSSFSLDAPLVHATAAGQVGLSNWQVLPSTSLQLTGSFSQARVEALLKRFTLQSAIQLACGSGEGSFDLEGTPSAPVGTAHLTIADFLLQGEHLDAVAANLSLVGNQLKVALGHLQSGTASLAFSGVYAHATDHWEVGTLQLAIDSNRFPLARLYKNLGGQTELHANSTWTLTPERFAPLNFKGTAALHHILWNGIPVGDLLSTVSTEGQLIKGDLTGNFRGSKIFGTTQIQIAPGTPVKGNLSFEAIPLESIMAFLQPGQPTSQMFSGSARGDLAFDGLVENPIKLHAFLQLRDLQVKGPPLRTLTSELAGESAAAKAPLESILQSASPVTVELTNGVATIRSAQLTGRDTQFAIAGTVGVFGDQSLRLTLNGGVDLRLLQLLYPDVRFGGQTKIAAAVTGTLLDPQLSGDLQFAGASVFSPSLPNGLSDLGGIVRFDQHRATLERITAHTGGGNVSFGGFVTYSANRPFVYRLESSGQNVRIRYANGISVTGNSQFSLTGTSEQSLLSGSITVSRVVLNPSADLGNLLALTSSSSVAPLNPKDYLSRLQMDIHVDSSPDLQLDTALSSGVQAGIDVQLRGTPTQPIILGSIEANQGDIKVFGSRYSINRGQISFTNSARLEPVLDLDLQTQARGITVDITVSGTLNKLNINYRSDPPLQPREIIALLTVGRTPQTTSSETNVQATNDANSLQSGANSVLGQAIAPVSNRLSKLFGITNIKIDPLVQGITNTPQARLTLEQQISRQITVTYITNLSQTSEQIFRLEYSLNPQFSLVALRDDNGEFGIDILYKKRFK